MSNIDSISNLTQKYIDTMQKTIDQMSEVAKEEIRAEIEYKIKPLEFRVIQTLKVIDVGIDICKILVVAMVSLTAASVTFPQISVDGRWLLLLVALPVFLLAGFFYIRMVITGEFMEKYRNIYNEVHEKFKANIADIRKFQKIKSDLLTIEGKRLLDEIEKSKK